MAMEEMIFKKRNGLILHSPNDIAYYRQITNYVQLEIFVKESLKSGCKADSHTLKLAQLQNICI